MNENLQSRPAMLFWGVACCFFLSGFAALLYQTAWMRQFSTVFGTSEIAVATVLSAYMAGLAIGAALVGRLLNLIKRPVFFYGILEAAIAVSALLVPVLLTLGGAVYAGVLGNQPGIPDASGLTQSLFYFCVSFLVILVPTTCMGATLPVLVRYVVTSDEQVGTRVGGMYAINTFGAVTGALIAGLLLLPELGLQGTIWCGVLVNFLVFLIAVFISRVSHGPADTTSTQATVKENETSEEYVSAFTWLILPVMLFSGVCTFVYEVLWTRLLSHILGGSVAAFSIMLGSFLSGIAIGSLVATRFSNTRGTAYMAFVYCQIAIAVTSMFIYFALDTYIQTDLEYTGKALLAFIVLMPATLFIGATFPLAVRIYTHDARSAATSSARVYAWNTFGAIMGAAVAGFFLVPALKYEGTIHAVVLLNLFLAVAVSMINLQRYQSLKIVAILTTLLVAILYSPVMPERILRESPISDAAKGDIIFYDVGRSATVLMIEEEGSLYLRNNGLPESGAVMKGAPPALSTQRLLGTLPVLIRPDIKSAMIVGLGTGLAVTGVPPAVEEIDVIELEQKVVDANYFIAEKRQYNPFSDPRVSLFINDARSALALTSKQYDMIVSQPSHPWSAGASHLYTREYMQTVSEHLTEGGVFLQWINTTFVDEALLKSLSATILEVYPYVRMYQWVPQVLFLVASDQPMPVEEQILKTGRPFKDDPEFYLELGVAVPEDVLAALMIDEEGMRTFAAGSQIITDNYNLMAMGSAQLHRQDRDLNIQRLVTVLKPWLPTLDPANRIHELPDNILRYPRITSQYIQLGLRDYIPALLETLNSTRNPQADLIAASQLKLSGKSEEANRLYRRARALMPENNHALYPLVEPWLLTLGRGVIPEEIVSVIESMTGSARAVVEASRAIGERNLQAVADLDAQLSAAEPADPWYREAVKLRIDWRNSVSNPELKQMFADQAWQILDLAMANQVDHEFSAMRLVSAAQADRHNEVIQSARTYILAVDFQLDGVEEGHVSPGSVEVDLKINQLRVVTRLVDEAFANSRDSALEQQELSEKLDGLMKRLEKIQVEGTSD